MRKFFTVIWICVYSAASAQTLHLFRFEDPAVKSYTVQFKEVNNLVIVPLIFNQSDTLHFILDSGAENVSVFGAEFDQPPLDTMQLRRVKVAGVGADEALAAYVAPSNTIRIGPIVGQPINIIYIPQDFVQFSELLGISVHGILGASIFHSFAIQIDYFKKEVTFMRPEDFKPRRRFGRLPVSILGNRPFADIFIEVHPRITMNTHLLVDLGESKPLSLFLSTNEAFILPYPNYPANLGKGITGVVTGKVARVSTVSINRHLLRNVITAFPDQEVIQYLTADERRNGSLGAGILKRFITVFDLPDQHIYLKRTSILRTPYSYDKTGLIVVARGEHFDQFYISGVILKSPAEKSGIKEDDRLLSINGQSVNGLKFGEVLNKIEEGGRHLHLEVERAGETLNVELKVHRFL